MTRVVVDPVTRIEGHLRVEAEVDGGAVTDAWSSSTMFRGIELILQGRDPRDAWVFAQRICGVCTTVHAIASIRAVEHAIGAQPPPNVRLLRNLISSAQIVHDHVVHFYHLHALDWVDLVSALSADPGKTASVAQSISDWPLSSRTYFAGIRDQLQGFVNRGRLGPYANAYWGHPAYRLPPEVNLLGFAHYLEALKFQRNFIRIHAILGGKNPHLQSFLVGGMATPIDPDSQASINMGTIAQLTDLVNTARDFVTRVYLPDLIAIASYYKDWANIGAGVGNYMSYGDYPEDDSPQPTLFIPSGIVRRPDLAKVEEVNPIHVAEYVKHSWYRYEGGDDHSLPPFKGETHPDYTGPAPPYEHLHTDAKYSWLKSPRYDDMPMEVGPLARMLVSYARGRSGAKQMIDKTLAALNLRPEQLCSTLGRVAARGIETQLLVEQMQGWVNGLAANMTTGELRIHDNAKWEPSSWPDECFGAGLHEAPRGSLGHWVQIRHGAIVNYQCVVPSTWNAGPRDPHGKRGPYEHSLIGTPVAKPDQPLEILRTVHSFDPCMACGVHVVDADRREIGRVKTQA